MAIQVLGTRAVGEGAARASGACGLNKLRCRDEEKIRLRGAFMSSLPNLRHRPRLGSAAACNEILKEWYTIWLLAALGCAAGGTKLFTGVEGM